VQNVWVPRSKTSEKILKNRIEPVFTTAPVAVPRADVQCVIAEFLRLPKSGTKDPIYGTSRSGWNNLILPCAANNFRPPIKSISHRKVGAIRGVRLIVAASAREYFAKLIAGADAVETANTTESSQPVRKARQCRTQPKAPRK
jgi:hypothetical protein